MSLINLPEKFIYSLLPEGIIDLDERGLILSVLGGYQDRLDDLRTYADKFSLFFSPVGLPEIGNNAVFVDLQSPQGNVYTRTLSIRQDTPASTADLLTWSAEQLDVDVSEILSVRLGQDLLRFVDTNVLDYLAATIGAVLYTTATNKDSPLAAQQQLLDTYFPRLKIKGTPASFDALGRLLGFDDVRMTPLWGRLTPRVPNDPGNALNNVDFNEKVEYQPQQIISPFYDPHLMDDGPFYTWIGTVSAGISDSNFYTSVVNGFNPYFRVVVTGTDIVHPSTGSYSLAGGGPHAKAYVDASSALRFEAVAEGASFNGLAVQLFDVSSGSLKGLRVDDRLSAVKYRTSLFDLGITMQFQNAEKFFGTIAAKPNKDVASSQSVVSFGTVIPAASPYRPFNAGTLATLNLSADYLTVAGTQVATFQQRTEASAASQQQDFEALSSAAFQISQAIEEARPATRNPRRTATGYLLKNDVRYATNKEKSVLFTVYSGSNSGTFAADASGFPKEPYTASLAFATPTEILTFAAETDLTDSTVARYRFIGKGGTIAGNYLFGGSNANSFNFSAFGTFATTGTVYAYWKPTSTEVVRSSPVCDSGTMILAAVGDYGNVSTTGGATPWYDVLEMIKSWNPTAVLLLGDNSYSDGDASGFYRNNITMKTWADAYGVKLYPVVGNHDIEASPTLEAYVAFFKPPGNGRYYSVRLSNLEFFSYNAGINNTISTFDHGRETNLGTMEPDGISGNSVQGRWLRDGLKRSTATWKIVGQHFPPWVSEATTTAMWPGYEQLRLPYKEWGATILLSGHMHTYERLQVNGFPVIISGNGGKDVRVYDGVHNSPYSLVRYPQGAAGDFGATRIIVTATTLRFEHWTRGGILVDTLTLTQSPDTCLRQSRPEDEVGSDDFIYEVADEFPWRRDVVGAGELVEVDYRAPIVAEETVAVDAETRVVDQTGAEYIVYGIKAADGSIRTRIENRKLTDYVPSQLAVAYAGDLKDQAALTPNELEWTAGKFVPELVGTALLDDSIT